MRHCISGRVTYNLDDLRPHALSYQLSCVRTLECDAERNKQHGRERRSLVGHIEKNGTDNSGAHTEMVVARLRTDGHHGG